MSQRKFSLILSLVILLLAGRASATVGGPLLIGEIRYDQSKGIVYYEEGDGGGKGCPVVIKKLNPLTQERTDLKTCDELLGIAATPPTDEDYATLVASTFGQAQKLTPLDLGEYDIAIEAQAMSQVPVPSEISIPQINVEATISQNGEVIDEIDFTRCETDPNTTYTGYRLPNSNTLLLEVSRTDICFETGYSKDDLFIISNVNFNSAPDRLPIILIAVGIAVLTLIVTIILKREPKNF